MIIHFSYNITPLPQSRPRFSRQHAYEEARVAKYKRALRAAAVEHMNSKGKSCFAAPVEVFINIRRNRPWTSRSFGDIDNHIKAVLDALNGVFFADDALIIKITAYKSPAEVEGVDVVVSDMEDY